MSGNKRGKARRVFLQEPLLCSHPAIFFSSILKVQDFYAFLQHTLPAK
jgi:hypothetical protein